jgi:hypothetical protein
MTDAADKVGLFRNQRANNKYSKKTKFGKQLDNKNLPWFNHECKRRRANYRKWVRRHKQSQPVFTFENRRKAHSEYKNVLKGTYSKYVKNNK